jgi:hypothetical protein
MLVAVSPVPPNSTCSVLMVLGAYLVADLRGLALATLERTIVPVGCLPVKLTCLCYLEGSLNGLDVQLALPVIAETSTYENLKV